MVSLASIHTIHLRTCLLVWQLSRSFMGVIPQGFYELGLGRLMQYISALVYWYDTFQGPLWAWYPKASTNWDRADSSWQLRENSARKGWSLSHFFQYYWFSGINQLSLHLIIEIRLSGIQSEYSVCIIVSVCQLHKHVSQMSKIKSWMHETKLFLFFYSSYRIYPKNSQTIKISNNNPNVVNTKPTHISQPQTLILRGKEGQQVMEPTNRNTSIQLNGGTWNNNQWALT